MTLTYGKSNDLMLLCTCMENDQITPIEQKNNWNVVTPLSKYLAMLLFIVLPFLGGYIGYVYAPEKTAEIEKVVVQKEEYKESNSFVLYTDVLEKVDLTDGYTVESYACDYNGRTINCYQLIKKDSHSVKVMLSTITDYYHKDPGPNIVLPPQLFPSEGSAIYFKSGIPESDSCCRLIKFDIETLSFSELTYGLGASGEKFSPSNALLARSGSNEIMVYDITSDSVLARASIDNGANETLSSNYCGITGDIADIEWIDENTVQYGVYDFSTYQDTVCEVELLEKRLLKLDKKSE